MHVTRLDSNLMPADVAVNSIKFANRMKPITRQQWGC